MANSTAFNLQINYIGELTEPDRSASQIWLRYARAVKLGETNWLMRASLPWSLCGTCRCGVLGVLRRGGSRQPPLPEFYIGAHAAVANLSVLTRDPGGYRSTSKLAVIGP